MAVKIYKGIYAVNFLVFNVTRVNDQGQPGVRFILNGEKRVYHLVANERGDDDSLKPVNARAGYTDTPFADYMFEDSGDHCGFSYIHSWYQWMPCGQDNAHYNFPVPKNMGTPILPAIKA